MQKALLALFIAVALLPGLHSKAQEGASTLRKIAEFDLPGPSGKRFDYLTIDPDDHYLISPPSGCRSDLHNRCPH